jgi:hypothetical protein
MDDYLAVVLKHFGMMRTIHMKTAIIKRRPAIELITAIIIIQCVICDDRRDGSVVVTEGIRQK